MLKALFAALALAIAGPALADMDNVKKATEQALATYKAEGLAGVETAARTCYTGLDYRKSNQNLGRDVEYCIVYETAGSVINNQTNAGAPYFKESSVRAIYALDRARLATNQTEMVEYFTPRATYVRKVVSERL